MPANSQSPKTAPTVEIEKKTTSKKKCIKTKSKVTKVSKGNGKKLSISNGTKQKKATPTAKQTASMKNPKKIHIKKQLAKNAQQTKQKCATAKKLHKKCAIPVEKDVPKTPAAYKIDKKTGLPVDYEKKVEMIMHYINPNLPRRRDRHTSEKMLLNFLTKTLFQNITQIRDRYSNKKPLFSRSQFEEFTLAICGRLPTDYSEVDDPEAALIHFHKACLKGVPRRSLFD